jgi:hypothetical protein
MPTVSRASDASTDALVVALHGPHLQAVSGNRGDPLFDLRSVVGP